MAEEEKDSEKERESLEERKKKMREKMKEMQEKRGPGGASPQRGGLASMMQQMAGAGPGGGQQDRAKMEMLKRLSDDVSEIKESLKKIQKSLEKE